MDPPLGLVTISITSIYIGILFFICTHHFRLGLPTLPSVPLILVPYFSVCMYISLSPGFCRQCYHFSLCWYRNLEKFHVKYFRVLIFRVKIFPWFCPQIFVRLIFMVHLPHESILTTNISQSTVCYLVSTQMWMGMQNLTCDFWNWFHLGSS